MSPIIELYIQGMSRTEIAKTFEMNVSSVCKYLRRRGITKRREMELYAKVRAKGARVSDLFDDPLC